MNHSSRPQKSWYPSTTQRRRKRCWRSIHTLIPPFHIRVVEVLAFVVALGQKPIDWLAVLAFCTEPTIKYPAAAISQMSRISRLQPRISQAARLFDSRRRCLGRFEHHPHARQIRRFVQPNRDAQTTTLVSLASVRARARPDSRPDPQFRLRASASSSADAPTKGESPGLSEENISQPLRRIAVIGGGASGIFAAIAAGSHFRAHFSPSIEQDAASTLQIDVLEGTSKTLSKVEISGGGRCNVLHDTSKPVSVLLQGYPRGSKELHGILQKRFSPVAARAWFQQHGVQLKTEADGRMFPVTDRSRTVMEALWSAARQTGCVQIHTQRLVQSIQVSSNPTTRKFRVETRQRIAGSDGLSTVLDESFYDAVILATGSMPSGYKLVQSLGHSIVSPVPSLFTLSCKQDVAPGGILHDLAGLSVPDATVSFRLEKRDLLASTPSVEGISSAPQKPKRKAATSLQQSGPLLITHYGLSGPAALRLSAYGARDFAAARYQGELSVHWVPELGPIDRVTDLLWPMTRLYPKRKVLSACPLRRPTTGDSVVTKDLNDDASRAAVPKRLWASLVQYALPAETHDTVTWGILSKKSVRALAQALCATPLSMTGKGTFKEEFVTAGGVSLSEIDMTTMESKLCPGLYFCGELINVDGVTGGFNFMNCWGTGE
jgi:predicted flavoprotein YhiN